MLVRNRGLIMWLLALQIFAAGWGGILSFSSSGQTWALGDQSQQSFHQDRQESSSNTGMRLRFEAERTVQELKAIFKKESDQRKADIQDLQSSLLSEISGCLAAIDKEQAARNEAEATAARVGKDILRLQDRIDAETATRESDIKQVRNEMQEIGGNNKSGTDKEFQAVVLEDIELLKTALAAERDDRAAKDEEIVEAVIVYTHTLRDGLRDFANS